MPVCHPSLLAGGHPDALLGRLPRLHKRQTPDAWSAYVQETGLPVSNPAAGARYDLYSMLIAAALAGLGVALVPRLYVDTEITQGLLAAPWPDGRGVVKRFCLVLPEALDLGDGPLQTFARWVLGEADA